MYCKHCVLPESKPHIWLNEDEICNICLDFEAQKSRQKDEILLETELVKVLDKYRGKGDYDCLLMCSGGKDSTSALHFLKKRYHLNPLAFTFDNGFEDNVAVDNVRNAVNMLGVDWYYFRSDFMKEMFAEMVKDKPGFPACSICSLWYMQITYRTVAQFNIPLILGGWTSGQLSAEVSNSISGKKIKSADTKGALHSEMEILCQEIPSFISKMREKYPKYKDFPLNMEEARGKFKNAKKTILLSPHWFLPVDPDEYTDTIINELKWKPLESSYPENSTNCCLNVLGSYLSLEKFGFTHFHIEMSKLIRSGRLSREEAVELLKLDRKNVKYAVLLRDTLKKLGCDVDILQ